MEVLVWWRDVGQRDGEYEALGGRLCHDNMEIVRVFELEARIARYFFRPFCALRRNDPPARTPEDEDLESVSDG